ncbi:MAG: flippase-like domain-containing protein [Bacteroidia bacterium]|nr:flippase-like domain-containing protein [Bacteroidia bacterium]
MHLSLHKYMTDKNRKFFFFSIKILVGVALTWVLFVKLYKEGEKIDVELYKKKFSETSVILLLLFSLLLMPVNWIIESVKWKMIISNCLEKMSLRTAIKSVFTGVAFGNLAPGRATEFAGKILFVSEKNRLSASFLHFVSGSSQLMITIVFGSFAFMFSSFQFPGSVIFFYVFAFLLSLLFIFLCFLFLNPHKVFSFLQKFRFFNKYASGKIEVPRPVLKKLFALSLLRHLVFSLQYFLIIKCFFICDDTFFIFNGIFLSYLVMAVVPMFGPIEALMRGGIGILVFSSVEPVNMNVFVSSTMIWIINILIPTAIGFFFFLFKKFTNPPETKTA